MPTENGLVILLVATVTPEDGKHRQLWTTWFVETFASVLMLVPEYHHEVITLRIIIIIYCLKLSAGPVKSFIEKTVSLALVGYICRAYKSYVLFFYKKKKKN